MGVNSLPKTVIPDGVAGAIWPRPFCDWVQHANHSATEPRPNNNKKMDLDQYEHAAKCKLV